MANSIGKAVGHKSPDQAVSWGKRDLLTYAVGVGAKKDDFPFVYELDKSFAAIPTYPVVLPFKGTDHDVNLFADRMMKGDPVEGLPNFDPNRVVHATQSIEILKPLPTVSGDGWKMTKRITGVSENKTGIIVVAESQLIDPHGTPYAKLFSSSFNLGAKVTGEKFSKHIAAPPQAKPIPERKPDWLFSDQTTPEQAILFRLSGDYNPLHIDPRIGQASGFGGVILHGLSTFGFGARAIISTVAGGSPTALRLFGVRFTAPVRPGDALETKVWEVGSGPDGTIEVTFTTTNTTTGKVVLGGGIAYVKKAGSSKL